MQTNAQRAVQLREEAAAIQRQADEYRRANGNRFNQEAREHLGALMSQWRAKLNEASVLEQPEPMPRVGPPSSLVAGVMAEAQLAGGTSYLSAAEAAGRAVETLSELIGSKLSDEVLHGVAALAVAQVISTHAAGARHEAMMCDAHNDAPRIRSRAIELDCAARQLFDKAKTYFAELAA